MQEKKAGWYIYKGSSVLYTLLFSVLSLSIIAIVSYFFGFNLIRNPLSGNDAMNTLTYATWMNEYFPQLPLWYPSSAGGSSFLLGYPSFYSLSVVILHKVTSVGLIPAMGILNFASLLLPAWGVFFYVLIRFRMRVAALFAGLFYLLSPISYVLISGAGFLSNAYAAIYAVPFLLFTEWYLTAWILNDSIRKRITTLFFAGIFFVLTTLAHPVVTLGFLMLFAFYVLIYGFLKDKWGGVVRGVVGLIIASIVFYLLCAFWFSPFQAYTGFSNRDITFTANTDTLPPVTIAGMFGLVGPQTGYPFPNLSIVPFVWTMAAIGTILALVLRRYRLFVLGLLAFFCMYQMGTYTLWIFFTNINWFIGSFFVNRYYYTATMILLPIVAGIGIWLLCSLPFLWVMGKAKKAHAAIALPSKGIFSLVITAMAVGLTLWGLLSFNHYSGYYQNSRPELLHYGEETGINTNALWNRATLTQGIPNYCDRRSKGYAGIFCDNPAIVKHLEVSTFVYYCDLYAKADAKNRPQLCSGSKTISGESKEITETDVLAFVSQCQQKKYDSIYFADLCLSVNKTPLQQLQSWPAVRLSDKTIAGLETAHFANSSDPFYFLSLPETRLDVSPSIGSWTKEWGTTQKSSIINAYTGQLVLNKSFNSTFRDAMYQNSGESPSSVDEFAKYFGISAILNSKSDQTEKFQQQQWKETKIEKERMIWEPKEKSQVYSLEEKPLVLVIGSTKNQAYKQIFQMGTFGAISFDNAIMIEGKDNIDDYSLQELSQFPVLLLQGYSYHTRGNAYSLLEQYVRNGGSVFIDTGWQYITRDWGNTNNQATQFPSGMPISQTMWGNVGDSWGVAQIDPEFAENVTVHKFNPLKWENDPWSLAYADKSSLHSWAKPILTVGDRVVIAGGQLGKGKVVWSGMNLSAHAMGPINTDEIMLFKNIMKYLFPVPQGTSRTDFSFERTPDKLTVTVPDSSWQGDSLYFRESYYPYWKAFIQKSDGSILSLPIYTAGPRFMLVRLPEVTTGDKIIFHFDGGWNLIIPAVLSVLSWLLLFVLLIDAYVAQSALLKKIGQLVMHTFHFATRPVRHHAKKITLNINKEEEDY